MPVAQPPGGGRSAGHAEITEKIAGRDAGLLLSARWVLPVEPAGAVLEHHAVAVRDGAIEQLLPAAQAAGRFPGYEQVALPEHTLLPGLVNAHTHAAMALLRGTAAPAWPASPPGLSPAFVHEGTLRACTEMLRGGITCAGEATAFSSPRRPWRLRSLPACAAPWGYRCLMRPAPTPRIRTTT